MTGTTRTATIAWAAILVLTTFSAPSFGQTNPFVGTWILNATKSRFEPGPPMKAEKLIVGKTGAKGRWKVTDDEVFGDGTSDHLEWSTSLNGASETVTGGSDTDSVTERLSTPTTYKAVFKKSGRPVTWETAWISANGKTMHSILHGKAPDGTPWKYHLIFNRQ
jgi:hypothetical protein